MRAVTRRLEWSAAPAQQLSRHGPAARTPPHAQAMPGRRELVAPVVLQGVQASSPSRRCSTAMAQPRWSAPAISRRCRHGLNVGAVDASPRPRLTNPRATWQEMLQCAAALEPTRSSGGGHAGQGVWIRHPHRLSLEKNAQQGIWQCRLTASMAVETFPFSASAVELLRVAQGAGCFPSVLPSRAVSRSARPQNPERRLLASAPQWKGQNAKSAESFTQPIFRLSCKLQRGRWLRVSEPASRLIALGHRPLSLPGGT